MYCTGCGFKTPDNAKFCPSCGNKLEAPANIPAGKGLEQSDGDDIHKTDSYEEIGTALPCTFRGNTGDFLSNAFAELMGVKKRRLGPTLIYNFYGSPDLLIVIPVAKNKISKLPFLGLMLGTGGLGAGAIAALQVVSSKLEIEGSKICLDDDNPLKDALIFKTKELKVNITQKIEVLDFFHTETWFNFTGEGVFQGNEYEVDIEFGVVGKAEDTIAELCRILAINSPVIKKKRVL